MGGDVVGEHLQHLCEGRACAQPLAATRRCQLGTGAAHPNPALRALEESHQARVAICRSHGHRLARTCGLLLSRIGGNDHLRLLRLHRPTLEDRRPTTTSGAAYRGAVKCIRGGGKVWLTAGTGPDIGGGHVVIDCVGQRPCILG